MLPDYKNDHVKKLTLNKYTSAANNRYSSITTQIKLQLLN